jgi:hypothetical protein
MDELKKEKYADRLIGIYPRRQIQFIGPEGLAMKPTYI